MLGISIVALLFLQCCLSPSGISEAGMVTVTKEDTGHTVEIAVGDILQIELVGTPTTVYWWHFDVLNEAYLELINKETREISAEKLEGAPVLGIWQVRAKKAGTTSIAMAYRPWEGRDKAIDHFSLTVHIVSERR